jgi:hypothetical protein
VIGAPSSPSSSALPDPEIIPAVDEHPPEIPPNLAANQTLCANVTKFLVHRYWYAYEQQQMRLWPIWRRIDDAWRARTQTQDLIERQQSITDKMEAELTPQSPDGMSARGQNAALHKQIDALTKIGLQIAWDEAKPVRFTKPESVYEHPIYNPQQQAVDVGNALLDQNIHDIDLRVEYRKNWGAFCKYGHTWAWTDFRMSRETVTVKYRVGPDPISAQAQIAMLVQQHEGQQPTITPTIEGGYEIAFAKKMV